MRLLLFLKEEIVMFYDTDKAFKDKIDSIIHGYLYNIDRHTSKNFFGDQNQIKKSKHIDRIAFGILNPPNLNQQIVKEEMLFEGCTRVFLINPILDELFKYHNIDIEWEFGMTFSNFTISVREYENVSFIEFIICVNGKHIGYRYTPLSHSSQEPELIGKREYEYIYKKKTIPGFSRFNTIDEVFAIDWTGEPIQKREYPSGQTINDHSISFYEFYNSYFSNYNTFIKLIANAVEKAKRIITLKAAPQLTQNNTFVFKQSVLHLFSKEHIEQMQYIFSGETPNFTMAETDNLLINNTFYNSNLIDSLIGNSGYAKCFITSEYLFNVLKPGLTIDYTSVITGYLKSVEQLLYIYYISAFCGQRRLEYWDKCNRKEYFDDNNLEKYRIDPYGSGTKQEFYWHPKKEGKNAPTIGSLVSFIRYFNPMWNVSEAGKEYIITCFNDYCNYCRNLHFHKDNIENTDYDLIKRIRNNTIVCIYYILGAFKLMDEATPIKEQLQIIDYSFEKFYQKISLYKYFRIHSTDGYNGYVSFENKDSYFERDETGHLLNVELRFVKIDSLLIKSDLQYFEYDKPTLDKALSSEEYISANTLIITRDNIPLLCEPINVHKKRPPKE